MVLSILRTYLSLSFGMLTPFLLLYHCLNTKHELFNKNILRMHNMALNAANQEKMFMKIGKNNKFKILITMIFSDLRSQFLIFNTHFIIFYYSLI